MKSILKNTFIHFISFFVIASVLGGIDYSGQFVVLLYASIAITLLNLLLKPILNLLLMPINLLTMGGFRWVINAVVLVAVTLIIPEFKILGFTSPGFSFSGFSVPPIKFSFILALILVSFLIEVIGAFINWLFD